MGNQTSSISSLMTGVRRFPPPASIASRAHVRSMDEYDRLYERSIEDPDGFWLDQAKELVTWFKEPTKGREYQWDTSARKVWHRWFEDGELNVSYNCLDRHLPSRGNKTALIWQGEPEEDQKEITYSQLHQEVNKFANVLKSKGIKKGDRVCIYLPMIPELPVVMVACARIGAIHSVVFGGFSAESLRSRILDSDATLVICADVALRAGKRLPSKAYADEAVAQCPNVRNIIVVQRGAGDVPMKDGRDSWFHEEMAVASDVCPPEPMRAEDPFFVLYTSGSTGRPKGVLHTTGGYLVHVSLSHKLIFDLREEDIYWCTADIGWVTGHSYVVYGPLANGATSMMFEGVPTYPDPGRFWHEIQKHRVSIFYTAPTAIRALMQQGEEWPRKYDLSSLRILGSVGEPINPEAWMWYHDNVGRGRCPVVDTWWQTETGGILITPLPGAHTLKPGSASRPFFGVETAVLRDDGTVCATNEGGKLCITKPWPGMMRTLWGDHERFIDTYFSVYPNVYFTGDGCRIDPDGDHWLMGRIDDVVNVSGHRLGTAEVESALVSHPKVAEAAVTPIEHAIKGQGLFAYVTLVQGAEKSAELAKELMDHVAKEIGPIARPDRIQFADALPKTRSGKIMRRILRKIATGELDNLGDTTTLADPSVVDVLIAGRVP